MREPTSTRNFGGENWADRLARQRAYADRDPAVLVVGGGQAGLMIAARLHQLGVDTLIVDRHERIGDNWRKRYHSLTLHNEMQVNHLPYMPFPPTWPVFIPKDMLANWFELYVEAMELNSGPPRSSSPPPTMSGARWTVTLKRADGSERVMHPRHVVFCNRRQHHPLGTPDLPGLADFKGAVCIRATPADADNGRAEGAGAGHRHQRPRRGAGPAVARRRSHHHPAPADSRRQPEGGASAYAIYARAPSTIATCWRPRFPIRCCSARSASTKMTRRPTGHCWRVSSKRGFRLTSGEDGTGCQIMYLRRGGGYYFNVGCSS